MSVSIVSNTAANLGISASGAAASPINELPADFATLLFAQTRGAAQSQITASTAGLSNKLENSGMLADKAEKSGDEPFDSAMLGAMLGILQPPVASPQPQNVASFGSGNHEDNALLETPSELTSPIKSESNGADSKSTSKENGSLINSLQEKAPPIAALANEAANIAADSPGNYGPSPGFDLALTNVAFPQEKLDPKQVAVSTPLTSPTWPEKFGERIVWLAKNNQQSAQININPPQLGPVQITLNLSGDQANAIFTSPHPEVRQSIEASLPQLREMLASVGISLGDANVGANFSQQSQHQPFLSGNRNQSMGENAILPANEKAATIASSQALQRGRGLVDLFA